MSSFANGTTELTNQSASNCVSYKDPTWAKVLKGTTYCILIILSLLGNSLVLHVISRSRSMRSTTNFLIANMAVADLLITCVSMPIVTMVNIQGFQNFNNLALAVIVCKLNPLIHGTSMESAIFSLMAIAFDRLFAIVTPLKKVITFFRVKIIIAGIWFLSVLTLAPLIYVIRIEKLPEGFYYCHEQWPEGFDQEYAARAYTVVLFLFFYGIPISAMMIVYPVVIYKLWGRGKEIQELLPAYVQRKRETNRKVLKMLVTVVVTFALCWLTFHVRMFLGFFGQVNEIPCALQPHLYFMAFSIAHSNSAITPLIYYFFNGAYRKQFQRVLMDVFQRFCRCCNGQDIVESEDTIRTAIASQNIPLVRFKLDSNAPWKRNPGAAANKKKLGAHRPRRKENTTQLTSQ